MAIAQDASTDGGATSSTTQVTYAHTCTGTDRILFVGILVVDGDIVTSVTYNGTSLTQVEKMASFSTTQYIYTYMLVNPDSGSNNIVIDTSSSTTIYTCAASYTGANQTGQPDANTNNTEDGTTSYTTTITTVADNSWAILLARNNNTSMTNVSEGTNSTEVVLGSTAIGFYDNSGAGSITPAGNFSMTVTSSSSDDWRSLIVSFDPEVAATHQRPPATNSTGTFMTF